MRDWYHRTTVVGRFSVVMGDSMSGSYRSLIAWQKAKIVALEVYRCTRRFPREEVYGLGSQMRHAAVSVPSNIAEGKDRYSPKEFAQFL
ncbi:MAG: four helix bundle protein [Terriglobales bacterium]